MSKPVLGYWNIRGFAQPIRHLLAYLGVEYEDKTYDEDESWRDEKFKLGLPFPNLPYWIDDKVKLTEKLAILKYLSRKYNPRLIPSEDKLWETDVIEGVLVDVWNMIDYACYHPSDAIEKILADNGPLKLGQVSTFMCEKPFCISNQPTYVDFLAYEVLYHYTVLNPDVLKTFPNLIKFMKNFEELDPIKKYMSSANYLKGPCYGKGQRKHFI